MLYLLLRKFRVKFVSPIMCISGAPVSQNSLMIGYHNVNLVCVLFSLIYFVYASRSDSSVLRSKHLYLGMRNPVPYIERQTRTVNSSYKTWGNFRNKMFRIIDNNIFDLRASMCSLGVALPTPKEKREGGNIYEELAPIVLCGAMLLHGNI